MTNFLPVLDQAVSRTGQPTASARGATRHFLHHATHIRAPARPESADVVLLVVAELVTNAIRYTDGPCTLHLELHEDHVEIRVTDTSRHPPTPRPPHTPRTRGMGLEQIKQLNTQTHKEP
ncbi:ATP-binding protein, partial [Streptomyces sp. NPDC059956]|uniref:ATP-binding protein n=1 Tax=Streptomyces sp. NPDC059956 TaxID=3347015 RepID=UPI00365B1A2B